ncbi:LOW QUALITY PROTEIN: putative dipeptidase [Aspergillus udagawae]|uniref:Dipeptidase n=1 Tax=Aspergillus udagawae TaxID=91492 RepID=A0A8H3RNZ2_9EURO|nr:LOW QUALITY PROTEIN: putative dipeptidase [Aspergillus udagawae]
MKRLQQAYPHVFPTPPNSSTALEACKDGRIISPLGIEGLHSIGNSFAQLREFYQLGVSYAILTHDCHNLYLVKHKSLVWEMNRLGMIVDLAHVSADTMRDVLGGGKDDWSGSRAPVIFSHSSAYALCHHPRNVPDDVLQLVGKRNSLVMVNFYSYFVSYHIEYIGNLVGYGHGVILTGSTFYAVGWKDVSKFLNLIRELLKRGISDEDVSKVIGGNLLRLWSEVGRVALEMMDEGALPVENTAVDLE